MISLVNGNALRIPLADKRVQCVVTSPPYFSLRDYQVKGQIGLEPTPAAYVANIVAVMREIWRVLRDDGVLWLNLGDSYASGEIGRHDSVQGREIDGKRVTKKSTSRQQARIDSGVKQKDLLGIPWRVAFALQDDGWYLRSDIIWAKPNPMPESVTDRPTKAHEYVFLLTKQARYYYDAEAIKESGSENTVRDPKPFGNKQRLDGNGTGNMADGVLYETPLTRNARSVWTIATSPYSGAHHATFPPELARRCVLAGTSQRGRCPVCGKAWVRVVDKSGSNWEDRKASGAPMRYGMNNNKGEVITNYGGSESITIGWRPQCDHYYRAAEWEEYISYDDPKHPTADELAENERIAKLRAELLESFKSEKAAPCIVIDPFTGSGTVGEVCRESLRDFVGVDLSLKYLHDNAMPRAMQTNTAAAIATLPMFAEMQL